MGYEPLSGRLNYIPRDVEEVYMMGIGGVGMGGLAVALKEMGYRVRGSDNPLYPPMSEYLAEAGVEVASGYDPSNLYPLADLVIVGNVIRRTNPEVGELARAGVPFVSMAQAVGELLIGRRRAIVVAGTHGKSTTTAMVAHILSTAGLQPGWMVGAVVKGRPSVEAGRGGWFVVEGDEYDTAFFDKRPKFVHYRPWVVALGPVDYDHGDIYPSIRWVQGAFRGLCAMVPAGGVVVANATSARAVECARAAGCRVDLVGRGEECRWRLMGVERAGAGGSRIELLAGGQKVEFVLPLAGEHNALNALVAIGAAAAAGVEPSVAGSALETFQGLAKRQQVVGVGRGVVVAEDFAHHPREVEATLKAIRDFGLGPWAPGQGRIVAVFEPRSNTSRRKIFEQVYPNAFRDADLVMLCRPTRSDDMPPDQLIDVQAVAEAAPVPAQAFDRPHQVLEALVKELRPGDLCVIMSNGDFADLPRRLLKALQ